MQIYFKNIHDSNVQHIVVGLGLKQELSDKQLQQLNISNPSIIKSLKFEGKIGEKVNICLAEQNKIITLVGLGPLETIDQLQAMKIGGALYIAACNFPKVSILVLPSDNSILSSAEYAANIAYGVLLRSYKFEKYFTSEESNEHDTLEIIDFILDNPQEAQKYFEHYETVAKAVNFTRDLVSEPSNKLDPEIYAKICKKQLSEVGIKVKILDEKDMEKLGMHSLLGVGKGSEKESQLVVMEYYGDDKDHHPIALVGKGVTFDTGGISLKPSENMERMKYDMAGSAVVVGTMYALAARKAQVNLVGVIGLVENMPGGNAQKPGDVVKSMSGQTIEVINTDAEGRLILADALWYCQEEFKPRLIIDIATLTGAIIVSLSNVYGGLFTNNEQVKNELMLVGNRVGEKVWPFPLHEDYDRMLKSEIADMRNISNGKGGGSITAAQFLKRFIQEDTIWVHLDIAGVTWADKPDALSPVGATGFGVRLLEQFIREYHEQFN